MTNSCLIIGGQKRGFAPHLIWGACPGCSPRVYAYGHINIYILDAVGEGIAYGYNI